MKVHVPHKALIILSMWDLNSTRPANEAQNGKIHCGTEPCTRVGCKNCTELRCITYTGGSGGGGQKSLVGGLFMVGTNVQSGCPLV